ncbi:transposase [Kitasatospora sp. NPDC051914]|uniref:transposase n=1 Tax=Kitasatospora sp. NPDC051914 TaxID=3154945 RepID=UPI0034311230
MFVATLDNTGEQLAAVLHEGSVSANDAAVNIDVLARAVAQLPWWRRQKILFRVDGAGFSHDLLDWIASAGGRASPTFRWEYSAGWAVAEREQAAIEIVDRKDLWQPATGERGQAREDAFVADITGLLGDLTAWPKGHRVIARKEPLHPRYVKDASAYEITKQARYQTFATNSRRGQIAFLDARHRKRARVEPKIRDQKASGMGLLPSREMTVNAAWLTATAIACDLRLASTPRPGRRGGQHHPQDPALPHPPRPRPTGARPAQNAASSSPPPGPGRRRSCGPSPASSPCPGPPDHHEPIPASTERRAPQSPAPWKPASSGATADARP